MTLVADFVLESLREWGVQRVHGYPGDGINGLLGAFDRAGGEPECIQTRHEEMAAFMACAHAKFTGEQRAMAGDPKFPGSQEVPDIPDAQYAELIGLKGAYCDKPKRTGRAWGEALSSDRPAVLQFKVDAEIAPVPPRITETQGKKAAKAAVRDPQGAGVAVKGARQKITELTEHLPGRRP
ncbi:thiamine pyrophosphate-binding protein [Streptomyces sp. EMB24]|uniref:thiamine pyrophosphate-binding protein n=1 Tax=Streptomyces sp. EMB24 TaxID=2835531 RepID=UPI00227C6A99|nr:thiamine pyrophosphate-binding protein [Streptomyces sp. EMB24]